MGWFDRKIYFYFQHSHALTSFPQLPASPCNRVLFLLCCWSFPAPLLIHWVVFLVESTRKAGDRYSKPTKLYHIRTDKIPAICGDSIHPLLVPAD